MYVTTPYVGLLLSEDLSPVEAWNHFRGAIVHAADKAAYRPIIDWLNTAIVRSGRNTYSALMAPNSSESLPGALLLKHQHCILLSHLPGLYPSINRAAGTRIAESVGEVAVDLRKTQIDTKRVWDKKENKGAADYFWMNLAQLLNLVQVTD